MGVLKDVLDVVKELITSKDMTPELFAIQKTSLSKKALEGTLQFPVLVTSSLEMETIQMISKALEKNYASFAQITMTMNPFMKLSTDKTVGDYIKSFHQNSDTKSDIIDLSNFAKDMYKYSPHSESNVNVVANENGTIYMISIVTDGVNRTLYENNKKLLKENGSDLNQEIANNKLIPKFNYNLTNVTEAIHDKYNPAPEIFQALSQKSVKKDKMGKDIQTSPREELGKEIHTLPRDVLKWSQVQKLNELIPTQMTLKIKVVSDDNTPVGDIEVVIGIKSTLHPIKTDEMIINTVNACKNNNAAFNFLRWTTGEISFVKDFILNINSIKNDIASNRMGASRWWTALKRRAALAHLKVAGKQILPNATLVMSMDEVNYIKNQYGYDLMSPYFLTKVMKTYFLLGFVVVDNSTQVGHFMFDGQESFQTYSFSSLKKESSGDDSLKQMLSIIRKV